MPVTPSRSQSRDLMQELDSMRDTQPVPTLKDYDNLLRALLQETAQRVLPSLSRGQAARSIAEKRLASMANKGQAFFMNELNSAAGDICEALDCPEAMLLLDIDSAMAANFPPLAVALGGLLTPFVLQVQLVLHVTQIVVVLIPFGALCTWAFVQDAHAPCDAIPTIHVWLWVQLVIVYVLVVARIWMVMQIRANQIELNEKAAMAHSDLLVRKAVGGVNHLTELREAFVRQAALVQRVLLVDEQMRKSWGRHIVGLATSLWLLATLWTFVLVVGWALVPGTVDYHSPVGARPGRYCGAWATVVTARISCVAIVVFFFHNAAVVLHWCVDVASKNFGDKLATTAQRFDEGVMGLPIAQLIVKAFIVRDNADIRFSRLAVAMHEKTTLSREIRTLQENLEVKKQQFQDKAASVEELERVQLVGQGGAATGGDLEGTGAAAAAEAPAQNLDKWLDMWRRKGEEAVHVAQAKAVKVERARQENVDRVLQHIVSGSERLIQSEAMRSALQAAEVSVRKGYSSALELEEAIHSQVESSLTAWQDEHPEAVQAVFEQAAQAAQVVMDRGQKYVDKFRSEVQRPAKEEGEGEPGGGMASSSGAAADTGASGASASAAPGIAADAATAEGASSPSGGSAGSGSVALPGAPSDPAPVAAHQAEGAARGERSARPAGGAERPGAPRT